MTGGGQASDQSADGKRWCVLGAVCLSLAHVLSVLGMWYQSGFITGRGVVVNFALWLSPIIVLFVMRRTCAVVGILAVPLSTIFVARVYYGYERYSLGVHSGGAKGDWGFWLATFTGVASVAILSLWVLYRIAVFFGGSPSTRS